MKTRIAVVISVLIITAGLNTASAASEDTTSIGYRVGTVVDRLNKITSDDTRNMLEKFSDMSRHWSRNYVGKLACLEIISGMPDGSFCPNQPVKVDEFIKMTVYSLGYKPGIGTCYWAQPCIDTAIQEGLIEKDEFKDFKRPITREEMASIAVRAAMLKESAPDSDMDELISMNIIDFEDIDNKFKQDVITAYSLGLLTGTPDGRFNPKSSLTRGEASTVILRSLDVSVRIPWNAEDGYAIKLNNYSAQRVLVGDSNYEKYDPATYIVARPDKRDEMRTAITAQQNLHKSRGYAFMVYNPDVGGLIGVSFYESQQRYFENKYDYHMSIHIKIDNYSIFPYSIVIQQPEKVKVLHREVIANIFGYLFENDLDGVMYQFDKYIEMGINRDCSSEESFGFNDRKVVMYKLDGDEGFTVWIYSRAE